MASAQMDGEGWIPLAVVANFNRVRMLTPDMMLIVDALRESSVVDVSKDSAFLRAKETWSKWILPPQQRDLSHKRSKPEASDAASAQTNSQEQPASSAAGSESAPASTSQLAAAAAAPAAGSLAAAVSQATTSPSKVPAPPPPAPKKKAADDEEDLDEDEDLFEMDEVRCAGMGVFHDCLHAPHDLLVCTAGSSCCLVECTPCCQLRTLQCYCLPAVMLMFVRLSAAAMRRSMHACKLGS